MKRKSLRETTPRAHARARAMHEIEISHGRGVVASTLKLLRDGAVGFIDWLNAAA